MEAQKSDVLDFSRPDCKVHCVASQRKVGDAAWWHTALGTPPPLSLSFEQELHQRCLPSSSGAHWRPAHQGKPHSETSLSWGLLSLKQQRNILAPRARPTSALPALADLGTSTSFKTSVTASHLRVPKFSKPAEAPVVQQAFPHNYTRHGP